MSPAALGSGRWSVCSPRRGAGALFVLVLAGGLAACNGPGADEAGEVAQSFGQLVTSDAASACDLLSGQAREQVEKASKKQCPDALGDEDLPGATSVRFVEVYGHDAVVHLEGDTVFLARYAEGWKVTGAECNPGSSEDAPYDCDVSGK